MEKKRIVRIRNGFSDRNGIRSISREMQVLEFEKDTRIVLFNKLKNLFDQQVEIRNLNKDYLIKTIVENAFNDIYERYSDNYSSVFSDILTIFKGDSYDSIIDLIEFICNLIFETEKDYNARYQRQHGYCFYVDVREQMNITFENEFVGYRFIGDKIARITNKAEMESIEESLMTPYDRVNGSISKAMSYISETGNKDYKNAIKEAITAVEEMVNILLNTSGLTLSNAITQLADKNIIDENLKISIKSLYKYTNEKNGVRHGNNKDNDDISFDDAKFIILICSSTINYFCSLANVISDR